MVSLLVAVAPPLLHVTVMVPPTVSCSKNLTLVWYGSSFDAAPP